MPREPLQLSIAVASWTLLLLSLLPAAAAPIPEHNDVCGQFPVPFPDRDGVNAPNGTFATVTAYIEGVQHAWPCGWTCNPGYTGPLVVASACNTSCSEGAEPVNLTTQRQFCWPEAQAPPAPSNTTGLPSSVFVARSSPERWNGSDCMLSHNRKWRLNVNLASKTLMLIENTGATTNLLTDAFGLYVQVGPYDICWRRAGDALGSCLLNNILQNMGSIYYERATWWLTGTGNLVLTLGDKTDGGVLWERHGWTARQHCYGEQMLGSANPPGFDTRFSEDVYLCAGDAHTHGQYVYQKIPTHGNFVMQAYLLDDLPTPIERATVCGYLRDGRLVSHPKGFNSHTRGTCEFQGYLANMIRAQFLFFPGALPFYTSNYAMAGSYFPTFNCSDSADKWGMTVSYQDRDSRAWSYCAGSYAMPGTISVQEDPSYPFSAFRRTTQFWCNFPHTGRAEWFTGLKDYNAWSTTTATDDPCPTTVHAQYCGDRTNAFGKATFTLNGRNMTNGMPMHSYIFSTPTDMDPNCVFELSVGNAGPGQGDWNCVSGKKLSDGATEKHPGTEGYDTDGYSPKAGPPVPNYNPPSGSTTGFFGARRWNIQQGPFNEELVFEGCECDIGKTGPIKATTGYTEGCVDCHCDHDKPCHWAGSSTSGVTVCDCGPGFGDPHCKVNCMERCSGHAANCSSDGGYPDPILQHCDCLHDTFGFTCQHSCNDLCHRHPLTSTSCDHTDANQGCDCAIGWRGGAEPVDPAHPLDTINKRTLGGTTPYTCVENDWHRVCDANHTVNGIDHAFPNGAVACACADGWGGPLCADKCAPGCKSCASSSQCWCNAHGFMDIVNSACVCDEGYAGINCTMLLQSAEACSMGIQPQRTASLPAHGDERLTGIDPHVATSGLDSTGQLCVHALAYNTTTRRCTHGYDWESVAVRLTDQGEDYWQWARRLVYRLHKVVINKTEADSLVPRLQPAGQPVRYLSRAQALEFCALREPMPAMCGDPRDPYRVPFLNQVFQRGALLKCPSYTSVVALDIMDCWASCAQDPACSAVTWDARSGMCGLSANETACTLVGGSLQFYTAIKSLTYYGSAAREFGHLLMPWPRNNPKRPRCGDLFDYHGVCINPFFLTYNYEDISPAPRIMLPVWQAYANWDGSHEEQTSDYVRRVNTYFTGQPLLDTVAAHCASIPDAGELCYTFQFQWSMFCDNWHSHGLSVPSVCTGTARRLENAVFKPNLAWPNPAEAVATVETDDPLVCVRALLDDQLPVLKAIALAPGTTTRYHCSFFPAASLSVPVASDVAHFVWMIDNTDYTRSYPDLLG